MASLSRNVAFGLATLSLIVVILELGGVAAYHMLTNGRIFEVASFRDERAAHLAGAVGNAMVDRPESEILHPYIGFSLSSDHNDDGLTDWHNGIPISEYGFLDDKLPFVDRRPGRYVVLITGGSVAFHVSTEGRQAFEHELRKVPFLEDAEIVVVRAALGGFKQPQQLMALSFFLSLGAHFDAVVNLDGFNEIVLPFAENLPSGVFPFYPRKWALRVAGLERATLLLLAEAESARQGRISLVDAFDKPLFRHSHLAGVLELAWDSWLSRRDRRAQEALAEAQAQTVEARGPNPDTVPDSDSYDGLARQWVESSVSMRDLCEGRGIDYWHFLQPNQYLEGSKPMGAEEREVALAPGTPYAIHATAGYPVISNAGQTLVERGVRFGDLTHLFRDRSEALYTDACCHMNARGNSLVGAAIGARVARDLRTSARTTENGSGR